MSSYSPNPCSLALCSASLPNKIPLNLGSTKGFFNKLYIPSIPSLAKSIPYFAAISNSALGFTIVLGSAPTLIFSSGVKVVDLPFATFSTIAAKLAPYSTFGFSNNPVIILSFSVFNISANLVGSIS